ncbi:hypothetical protein [Vibrio rotiferianus]|uniref:hypothetical protein n=1 Tax=Vibrio rotiferianus TaxID=190895 RepID=UPI003908DF57
MDSQAYLALNAWLQKADSNYIEGRVLWLQHLVNGACNLLWLSSEQLIKVLLLQNEIEDISAKSENLTELHTRLEKRGRKLGHSADKLTTALCKAYPAIDIERFLATLHKLQSYFYRRYAVHSASSISLSMLTEVDEMYFLLRSQVLPEVGLGVIDEIHIQRKHQLGHPLHAFSYVYLNNDFFKPRKHRSINIEGLNGAIHKECGD